MTYSSGTITSATPALAMRNAFGAVLVAAGWQFVEEHTVTTVTHGIYRNPASLNSAGKDFYIALGYATAGTGALQIRLFERWDATAKTCQHYAPLLTHVTGTAIVTTPGPNLYTLDRPPTTDLNSPGAYTLTSNTTGFSWFASVSAERAIFAVRVGTTDNSGYVGLYEDFHPTISQFPLVLVSLASAGAVGDFVGNNGGSATREPGQTVAFNNNMSAPIVTTNYTPVVATELYSGKPNVSRVPLNGRSNNYLRGLLKDVVRCAVTTPALVNGDTLTIDGVLYTRMAVGTTSASGFFVPQNV